MRPALPAAATKPGHWICGSTHGNEYTGTEVSLYIINKLLSEYESDPKINALVDRAVFYVCPVVNPDGLYGSPGSEFSLANPSSKFTSKDGEHLDKPTAAEDIFDGRIKDVGAFYGEVVRNGRYHVFGEWKDFQDYLAHKEITFTYTEIGTGPKGETVIYALNKKTKDEGRPVALVEQFNALRK